MLRKYERGVNKITPTLLQHDLRSKLQAVSRTYSCQLVNPLCPDDLCVLPLNHKGQHKLSTMSAPAPLPMRKVLKGGPYTDEELIDKGYALGIVRGYYERLHI